MFHLSTPYKSLLWLQSKDGELTINKSALGKAPIMKLASHLHCPIVHKRLYFKQLIVSHAFITSIDSSSDCADESC